MEREEVAKALEKEEKDNLKKSRLREIEKLKS